MTTSNRFWIGGGGALLPLLVTLLAVDLAPLIDNAPHLTIGTYVGAAIRYLLLFAIGGVVAALNSDEIQPIKLTDDEIRERMSGNLCRCGAYPNIVAAIRAVEQESRA